jgi:hypothetical protein
MRPQMRRPERINQRGTEPLGIDHPDGGLVMKMVTRTVIGALSIAVAGTVSIGAMAQTRWDREHPRREQVNGRLENQNRRINQELREGEITKGQARQLHQEDRAIRQEERGMARLNGGHITPAEQKALNQQENQVSRQIGR